MGIGGGCEDLMVDVVYLGPPWQILVMSVEGFLRT